MYSILLNTLENACIILIPRWPSVEICEFHFVSVFTVRIKKLWESNTWCDVFPTGLTCGCVGSKLCKTSCTVSRVSQTK